MSTQEYKVTVYDDATIWHQNGKRHRLDGPAMEYVSGTKLWYKNGKLHRLDGPACHFYNGTECWYEDGKRHRLDGPAVERAFNVKQWFIDDLELTEAEFNARTNPIKEMTVAEIATALGHEVKVIKS